MAKELKEYTLEEVAKHNKEGDIWVVWRDGLILDVSEFQKDHPGGVEILLEHAGTNIAQDFNDVGHSNDAVALARAFAIGKLKKAEAAPAPISAAPSPAPTPAKKVEEKKEETSKFGIPSYLLIAGAAISVGIAGFVAYRVLNSKKN